MRTLGVMARPLVLVSGFGPFERFRANPSGEVARALGRRPPPGVDVRSVVLPVSFARAPAELERALAGGGRRRPVALLGLGVHPERGFRLELQGGPRLRRRPRPDVDGRLPAEFARAEGPRSTAVDTAALTRVLREAGVRNVRSSRSAGGYVCEWLYHHLLEHGERLGVPALFVHVPPRSATPVTRQARVIGLVVRALAGA
jgi:pyroglutamyl-peptidase